MGDIRQQTSSTARAVGEAIGHKAEEVADRSRQAGAEGVTRAARTAEAVADSVAGEVPAVAEYVRGAAQKIERLAGDLREKKVGELLSTAADFGRSQPVAMLAGAALVGFALSRVIKAGVAAPAAASEPTVEYDPMKDVS